MRVDRSFFFPDLTPFPEEGVRTLSGRLSSKAWTKIEINDVYADLGAHLPATVWEA